MADLTSIFALLDMTCLYEVTNLLQQIRPYFGAFKYYLTQNLTCNAQFIAPKFASSNLNHHFRGFHAESSADDIFIFNNSGGHRGSGHRGLAVVAISFVDKAGSIIEEESVSMDALECMDTKNRRRLLTQVTRVKDDENPKAGKIFFEFHIWESGRVDRDDLDSKISTCIRHSMWDLATEFGFLRFPTGAPRREEEFLHPAYDRLSRDWIAIGLESNATSCKMHEVTIETRFSLMLMLKEMNKILGKQLPQMSSTIYHHPGQKPVNFYLNIGTFSWPLFIRENVNKMLTYLQIA